MPLREDASKDNLEEAGAVELARRAVPEDIFSFAVVCEDHEGPAEGLDKDLHERGVVGDAL